MATVQIVTSLIIETIVDSSIFPRVIILNGFYSKRFLSWRVIIPKIFISKGHYSEDFYPEWLLFWISE